MESELTLSTQEIHERLNHRCGQAVPIKHLLLLMERFREIHGQPITEANISAFLRYAW